MVAHEDRSHIHAGYCTDLVKTVQYYEDMPNICLTDMRFNVLIHVDEFTNEKDARDRLRLLTFSTKEAKVELIDCDNPDWEEVNPNTLKYLQKSA